WDPYACRLPARVPRRRSHPAIEPRPKRPNSIVSLLSPQTLAIRMTAGTCRFVLSTRRVGEEPRAPAAARYSTNAPTTLPMKRNVAAALPGRSSVRERSLDAECLVEHLLLACVFELVVGLHLDERGLGGN